MQRILQVVGPDLGSIVFNYLTAVQTRVNVSIAEDEDYKNGGTVILTTTRNMPANMRRFFDGSDKVTNRLIRIDNFYLRKKTLYAGLGLKYGIQITIDRRSGVNRGVQYSLRAGRNSVKNCPIDLPIFWLIDNDH